ncbi:MAG: integrase arm-type DNA-binding domain-containing protein [Conchiformibius sp.]|nr:integrase arm-type DNA-binding domain-containing protein [Conchiformibius sp.]
MPLNDRQIRNAKPAAKQQKLSDGGGLYLLIKPNGGKYWRLNFRFDGKQKTLAVGTYPAVSLAEARAAREQAKQMLAQGTDPSAAKQAAKQERAAALANTFKAIAEQWHTQQLPRWKPSHAARVWHSLELDVFPHIGNRPIAEITVRDIKAVLDGISGRGAAVSADKVRQRIDKIFNYAVILELVNGNPAAPLSRFIVKADTRHMPALPSERLTEFYSSLSVAAITQQNRLAIMILMLVFVRSNELRGAQWQEIDFQQRIWLIPAQRMKVPRDHLIPLADWTVQLLQELQAITGHTPYLFPSRVKDGYISEATLNTIINRMGYKGIATPHGFRSLASSILNEQGFNPDAIERQLAHVPKDKIRAAYNRAEYLPQRTEIMQWYADHLKRYYDEATNG